MRTLTRIALCAALALPMTLALAQTSPASAVPPANATSPAAAAEPSPDIASQPKAKRVKSKADGEGRAVHHRVKQFKKLDANNDGHVTPEEAAARPWLKRNFNQIDAGSKGYITEEDVRAFAKAHPDMQHPKRDKAPAQ